jgi:hypothetical protein
VGHGHEPVAKSKRENDLRWLASNEQILRPGVIPNGRLGSAEAELEADIE